MGIHVVSTLPLGIEQTNLVMMNKEFDDPQSL